jgi:hypothetical protein
MEHKKGLQGPIKVPSPRLYPPRQAGRRSERGIMSLGEGVDSLALCVHYLRGSMCEMYSTVVSAVATATEP